MNWPNVSTSEPVTDLILDFGGVLVDFDPAVITSELLPDSPWRDDLQRDLFSSPEWIARDRGTLTIAEAAYSFQQHSPQYPLQAVELILNQWPQATPAFDYVPELLLRVKNAGLGLHLLSNANDLIYCILHREDWTDRFDTLCISCEHQLLKPDLTLYEICLSQAGIKGTSAIYVDDVTANIEAASQHGLRGILFDGRDGLDTLLSGLSTWGVEL